MPRSLASKFGHFFPATLLLVVTFVVYSSVFGHGFSGWDDNYYVTDNETIRGVSWPHLKAAFTTFYVSNYAPVQIISYMLDYAIWGLWAPGFLLTNVFLHAANGALFYHLLAASSGRKVWPFVAALFFLLHPIQVESVAWISQRKNLLAMFFFLVAFHLYRLCQHEEKGWRLYYVLALVAFVLALLSKSVAIILAPVLILYDFSYGPPRSWRQMLVNKIPFLAASVAAAGLAIISQSQSGAVANQYPGGTAFTGFMTMLTVLVKYLGLLFWPVDLSIWYSPAIKTGFDLEVTGAGILSVSLLVLGFLLFFRRRQLCFWYVLFFIGLLPVSQIVPMITLMNDRYLYFPMLGAAAFLTALPYGNTEFADLRHTNRHFALVLCGGVALLLLTVVSVRRIAVWENTVSVWQDGVAHRPEVATPYYNLGLALMNEGRVDEAIPPLETAYRLEPDQGDTLNMLGVALSKKGEYSRAITLFETILRIDPTYTIAAQNLEYAKRGQLEAGRWP